MVLTRAKNQPGPDGVLGTADDIQDATNTDSPWVDQSQTYTSHPSHQAFLREYVVSPNGRDGSRARPTTTARSRPASCSATPSAPSGPDGVAGTADDLTDSGMAPWASVKAPGAPAARHQPDRPGPARHADARHRSVRRVHPRPARAPAARDEGPGRQAEHGRRRARRGHPADARSERSPSRTTSCASTRRSWATSRTTRTRARSRTRTARPVTPKPDADTVVNDPEKPLRRPGRRHSTTTSCSTRTSPPVTAAQREHRADHDPPGLPLRARSARRTTSSTRSRPTRRPRASRTSTPSGSRPTRPAGGPNVPSTATAGPATACSRRPAS